jgi:hypothetical protein
MARPRILRKDKITKRRNHKLRSSCIHCYDSAANNAHRFHGRCSFKRTHKTYCRHHRCGCQK